MCFLTQDSMPKRFLFWKGKLSIFWQRSARSWLALNSELTHHVWHMHNGRRKEKKSRHILEFSSMFQHKYFTSTTIFTCSNCRSPMWSSQAAVVCKHKQWETRTEQSSSCIPQHVCIPYSSIHTYPRRPLTRVTCWNWTLGRMQLTDSYEIQESDRHIENGHVIKIPTLLIQPALQSELDVQTG